MKKKNTKKNRAKKKVPKLFNSTDLINKIRQEVVGENYFLKQHIDLIADCVLQVGGIYECIKESFSLRIKSIDGFIQDGCITDAQKLLIDQEKRLDDLIENDEVTKRENEILDQCTKNHKVIQSSMEDEFKKSGIIEFINFANEKHNEYIESIKDKAKEYNNDIVNERLGSITSKESVACVIKNELWNSYLENNNLKEIICDFKDLAIKVLQHLEVRKNFHDYIIYYQNVHKRQVREIKSPTLSITGVLPWRILPNESAWSEIQTILSKEFNSGSISQMEFVAAKIRLQRIIELSPKNIYKGIDSFSDYFALTFDRYEKVVFESIKYGNAIYIVQGDWRVLSQKSKSELRETQKATIIRHEGDWSNKLKRHLGYFRVH